MQKILVNKLIKHFACVIILVGSLSCNENDKPIDKTKISGSDYRLFQDTKAWNLAKAIRAENIEDILSILRKDSTLVNFQEKTRGSTLLMMSILHRQVGIAKILLGFGANPNIHDKNGTSAIIMACADNELNSKIVQWLLNAGANVNDIEVGKRRKGNTTRDFPLIVASRNSNLPLVILLMSKGAEVNKTNEYGHTAIGEAALLDNYDIVLYLLKSGANADTEIFTRPEENNKSYKLKDVLLEDKSNSFIKKQILEFLIKPK